MYLLTSPSGGTWGVHDGTSIERSLVHLLIDRNIAKLGGDKTKMIFILAKFILKINNK